MGKLFDKVDEMLKDIEDNPQNVEVLVELAGQDAYNNKIVSKSAIHYECLGDPEKYDALRDLILKLEKQEYEKPEIRWEQNIASTLYPCLQSWGLKENGREFTSKEKEMHNWRGFVAIEILSDICEKRGIKIIGPLIAADRSSDVLDASDELLQVIEEKKLGRGSPETLKNLMNVGIAALSSKHGKDTAIRLLRKVIDDEENDLIYFLGPLMYITKNDEAVNPAVELLEAMEGKTMGRADDETMKHVIKTATISLKDVNIMRLVVRLLDRIVEEEKNNLIYFVGPLLAATQNGMIRYETEDLMKKMSEKRLGKADSETISKIAQIAYKALGNKDQKDNARRLLKRIIDEGENDLIYFVRPLVVHSQYSNLQPICSELLNGMEDKRLGKADSETIKKTAKVLEQAMKNGDQKDLATKMMKKIIDEGENDLIYFVHPLVRELQNSVNTRTCIELLNGMKDKKLGRGDAETIQKIERMFSGAIRNHNQKQYVSFFMNKLEKEEGITIKINGDRYSSPSWNGRPSVPNGGGRRRRRY